MRVLQNFNLFIKGLTSDYGFSLCGVARAEQVEISAAQNLDTWIAEGRNADMDWFLRNDKIRKNPSLIIESGATIVVMGYAYPPVLLSSEKPNIAAYAHATDYHFLLKDKLRQIIVEIKREYGEDIIAREFVDSAPVMERYWAVKAGLGWIGKNSMLINRKYGSYVLLCEIVLNGESDVYDSTDEFNGCGTCGKCATECSLGAIDAKGIDSRLCCSYLTIEHRGDFNDQQLATLRRTTTNWVYGCDSCLMACPWNKKIIENQSVASIYSVDINFFANFKNIVKNTPLERSGIAALRRNFVALCDKN